MYFNVVKYISENETQESDMFKVEGDGMKGKKIAALLTLVILLLPPALFSVKVKDEFIRKAALIRAVSQYFQWPESTGMNDLSKPFVIGIFGKDSFSTVLERLYTQEKYRIKDKDVDIRKIYKIEDFKNCHILFISKSKKSKLDEIIINTRTKPILTIGETEGFAQKGVLFNFYINKSDEIRFEINASAIRASTLIVDSELLSVARIINPVKTKQ
jgi:hypothetical protein